MSTNRKDTRKYADRREYLIQAVAKRRRDLKLKAIGYMGGSCMLCGYDKHPAVLDFHHVDPLTKSFGISSGGFSRSWASIKSEIAKCVLVCANCHREIEIGLVKVNSKHLQSVEEPLE
jgi:formate-dependent nitrite reductase cytochrome c552 subunit